MDKSDSDRLSDAIIVRDYWTSTNDLEASMKLAEQYGFHSQWHASGVITRANKDDTVSMEIAAFSVGDLAFVSAPYEMFDQNGAQIRDGSPFAMTFVATLCNGSNGYIASELCATHGCYGFDSRAWGGIGSAEELVSEYVDMLSTLYGTK